MLKSKFPNLCSNRLAGTCRTRAYFLEQLISLAVTQAVGIWSNESYVAIRGKRASREKFLDALTRKKSQTPNRWKATVFLMDIALEAERLVIEH